MLIFLITNVDTCCESQVTHLKKAVFRHALRRQTKIKRLAYYF